MQSVPITTNFVILNPAHGKLYSIQHYPNVKLKYIWSSGKKKCYFQTELLSFIFLLVYTVESRYVKLGLLGIFHKSRFSLSQSLWDCCKSLTKVDANYCRSFTIYRSSFVGIVYICLTRA
jgi:hypothetical protein